jgi:hypothetical protein
VNRALLFVLTLVACGDSSVPSGVDPTSLEGNFDCSGTTCTTGQICLNISAGIDSGSGAGGSHTCETPPSSCSIFDCTSQCSDCIEDLCSPTQVYEVVGRNVNCLGQ